MAPLHLPHHHISCATAAGVRLWTVDTSHSCRNRRHPISRVYQMSFGIIIDRRKVSLTVAEPLMHLVTWSDLASEPMGVTRLSFMIIHPAEGRP